MPTPPLPTLAIAKTLPRAVDLLVVGLSGQGAVGVPESVEAAYTKRFGTGVGELALSLGAKPKAGSRRTLPAADGARVIVVGIADEQTLEDVRQAAEQGYGRRAHCRSTSGYRSRSAWRGREASAAAEGALLGSYTYAPISGADDQGADGGIDKITVSIRRGPAATGYAGDGCRPGRADGPGLGQRATEPALSRLVRRPGTSVGQGVHR